MRWKRNKFTLAHPVLQVILPKEPDSEETIEINVAAQEGVWGFEFNERNVQWLRDYILKEHEKKQKD